jgi:ribonuclease R
VESAARNAPMPDRYTRRILEHLADRRYQPRRIDALAADLAIPDADRAAFDRAVRDLLDQGQVVQGTGQALTLPPMGREIVGIFRLNPRGFGFVVPDALNEHGDLFIPQGNTADALTGDHVRARVIHQPRRVAGGKSPYIGQIIDIIQRADKHYVGNLLKREGRWIVICDGRSLTDPVLIRDPHAKNAKEGDKVVIELIDYPAEDQPAQGVILEVLGEKGLPEIETLGVMRAYGLVERFDAAVTDHARAAARAFDEHAVPKDREDLTGRFIITIDPPDAKDYDDAISLRKISSQESGNRNQEQEVGAATGSRSLPDDAAWELGVHIADVSHFVTPGSPLDLEASKRGNSCYLPRKVVPMLPELLSNGVCSLQEGVHRFCKSCFLYYDAQGNVVGERFARTVIKSVKRLTYLEAQALIDGDLREARKHAKTEPRYPGELMTALKMMDDLSKIIRTRRLAAGMIVLGLPQVELIYDDAGNVVDAQPEDTSYTHTLIEMFMVEANEAAARLFERFDVPMIRRIHPDPDLHDMGELRNFARVAGYNIPARPSRRELQQLLDAVRGKPAQTAVHFAVLRTLSKAEYSPMLIGHFALASEHYTHFTSPIRRYPDLIVHRGIDAYLRHTADLGDTKHARQKIGEALRGDPQIPDAKALHEIGKHCSATERNAESAERDLRTYLVLDLLAHHLGDDFAGTVTGVTGGGAFIQLDKFLVDGFVKSNDLPGGHAERWRLNEHTGAIVAQRSGRAITIGDRFTVRIAKCDPVRRNLELVIIEDRPNRPPGVYKKLKRKQAPGAKHAHQDAPNLKHQKKHGKSERPAKKNQRRRKG